MIAKAEKEPTKIMVTFAGVSIGNTTARVGAKIQRGTFNLLEFDSWFCDRRLRGRIVVTEGGDDPDQKYLGDINQHVEIEGAFDVKGFTVKTEQVSIGLTFAKREIDFNQLGQFSNRSGYLVISEVGEIPDEKTTTGSEVRASAFLSSLEDPADDAWRLAPISELELSPKRQETLIGIGVETIGEFEDLRAGQVKGFPRGLLDVKGFGTVAITEAEESVLNWLKVNQQSEAETLFGSTEKPDFVRLRRSRRGFANDAHGLLKGSTWEVIGWEGDDPIVKTLAGDDVTLSDQDWESATEAVN